MKNFIQKHLDAISLGAIAAVVPLIGDLAWWHRDFILGVWTWHLALILFMFVVSIIMSVIAAIWYHKTRHDLARSLKLSLHIQQLQLNELQKTNKELVKEINLLKHLTKSF